MKAANRNGGYMTIAQKCMFASVLALITMGGGSAFARTDTNTVPYAESFENLTAWGGSYTNINITNGWYSISGDLSAITNYGTYTPPACGFPLPGATHTNVLRLDTEGTMLTNSFGSGFDMSQAITYMDCMILFVPSESAPTACTTLDSGIKAAVYLDSTTTNLVVYHGVLSGAAWSYNTNDIINSAPVSTSAWQRLTIAFDATAPYDGYGYIEMFQVLTNGVAVQSPNAYDGTWKGIWETDNPPSLSPTGTWFRSATAPGTLNKTLTAVVFQGTGYIDDLVVTTNTPAGFGATPYLLTVVNGGNGSTDLGSTNALTQVYLNSGSSTQIVYTARQWFEIASLTSNGVPVTAAANTSVYTQFINSISAAISNVVAFYQPTNQVTLTLSTNVVGAAGSADQPSVINVLNGSNVTINFTAALYSRISNVSSNGTPLGLESSPFALTIGPVIANMTAAGVFTRDSWTISQPGSFTNGSASPSGNISLLNGTGTNIVYSPYNWYYASATAGAYGSVSTNGSAATVTFTTVLTNTTAGATFIPKATGAVVANVPSSWALGLGVNEAWALAHPGLLQESYMLGFNTTNVNPSLFISGIGVSGTNVNVTVLLDNNSSPTNSTINGTLRLFATASLTNSFVEVGSVAFTGASFTNSGTHVVSFGDAKSNDFYEAEITLP